MQRLMIRAAFIEVTIGIILGVYSLFTGELSLIHNVMLDVSAGFIVGSIFTYIIGAFAGMLVEEKPDEEVHKNL
jgi:membrane protein DedA with SNARE-associated domain